MYIKRDLNLIPEETKSKYIKRTVLIVLGAVGGITAGFVVLQLIIILVLNIQIKGIRSDNEKYNTAKMEISEIQQNINDYNTVVDCYENEYFPFARFMNELDYLCPATVQIISIDTRDRLINEGRVDEEETEDSNEKNTEQEEEQDEDTPEEPELSDLYGQEIVIRGFGKNQDDISRFVYGLSNLSYIKDLDVTGIEEHKIEDGIYDIFEIIVIGGSQK